jgi:hypothetical protein
VNAGVRYERPLRRSPPARAAGALFSKLNVRRQGELTALLGRLV